MDSAAFHILSPVHREAVAAALMVAFGSPRVSAIAPIGGGASGAFPFSVLIGDRRYVVRVEGAASPLRNPHQYSSMRIAAEAGIAPRLYHVDEMSGIAVMDFIEERPLSSFPGGPHGLATAVGVLLGRVRASSSFPVFVEYPDIVGRLWAWVCQTDLFSPGVLAPCTEHLARIRDKYVWNSADLASSHNDPVPRNILFDGQRLWLIDWESAYRNDPLVDLAIALDNFAPSDGLERVLLDAWLVREADEALPYRLEQVRALTRLYYAGVFLSASASALGPVGDSDIKAPTIPEFQDALRAGRLMPGSPATKHILGKMYLASFLTGCVPPGLAAAV
jgi:hypothetical protein